MQNYKRTMGTALAVCLWSAGISSGALALDVLDPSNAVAASRLHRKVALKDKPAKAAKSHASPVKNVPAPPPRPALATMPIDEEEPDKLETQPKRDAPLPLLTTPHLTTVPATIVPLAAPAGPSQLLVELRATAREAQAKFAQQYAARRADWRKRWSVEAIRGAQEGDLVTQQQRDSLVAEMKEKILQKDFRGRESIILAEPAQKVSEDELPPDHAPGSDDFKPLQVAYRRAWLERVSRQLQNLPMQEIDSCGADYQGPRLQYDREGMPATCTIAIVVAWGKAPVTAAK